MICEVESCVDDVGLSKGRITANQWTSIVRQQILELEGPTYQYVPMFSTAINLQVFFLDIRDIPFVVVYQLLY